MEGDTEIEDRLEARLSSPRGRGRGGRAAGGGGGRRGGRDVDISRALSRLLRHQAESAGIRLDREGFAPLDRVRAKSAKEGANTHKLQWGPLRSLAPSVAEVRALVASSDKQRFSLKPADPSLDTAGPGADAASGWLVRANQGHSIKLDSEAMLRPIRLPSSDGDGNVPPVVVHGTYFALWPRIVASGGLRPMGRNHVHCATGVPEDKRGGASSASGEGGGGGGGVISGMRADAEVLVYVDVRRSLEDGAMSWWVSDNGVVLTEGDADGLVPLRYFREVVGRRPGVGTLWRDGEKVADLPEGIKGSVPPSKAGERGGRGRGRGR